MKHKYLYLLLPLCAVSSAGAATTMGGVTLGPISGLGANSTFAIWNTMNGWHATANPNGLAGTGSFPGTTMWAPQNSQPGSNESNTKLVKVSNGVGGGPYAASGSVYYGGFSGTPNLNGGTLSLSNASPLDNLQTVLFQIQIGEAATYDFHNHVLPVMSYTLVGDVTLHTLAAAASSNYHKLDNGTIEMPTGTEPLYINSYAMWFDFSEIAGDVESFSVSWTGVQHAQLYGVSLQQDDVAASGAILPVAVPEPSAVLLGGIGFLFLLRRRK
ncbi:PEP-CTERM sorting domain-containing protein [Luteolibacter yonseiensis]|uniref:PEP-CTERM sorting domain-containing protein n=1 Tax=Luteolibacter yonseiensis TaxID=1144680 RepID=A0A934R585_9BACT|nr:PEP-CTERM sorting domain-containing protein [Luteolibacter yonseiensis]MBK1815700.1 PEP-CTERM sorting domain-containing protein [Luteolibacter yonseiensis]